MSSLSDLLKFNKFVLKDLFNTIKDDPIRALLGGITPLDTGVQNALLGREDEPFLTQLGGATPQTFERARQSGIDTQAGETAQGVADIIAGIYGARGLGNLLPGAGEQGTLGGRFPTSFPQFASTNPPPQQDALSAVLATQQPQTLGTNQVAGRQNRLRRALSELKRPGSTGIELSPSPGRQAVIQALLAQPRSNQSTSIAESANIAAGPILAAILNRREEAGQTQENERNKKEFIEALQTSGASQAQQQQISSLVNALSPEQVQGVSGLLAQEQLFPSPVERDIREGREGEFIDFTNPDNPVVLRQAPTIERERAPGASITLIPPENITNAGTPQQLFTGARTLPDKNSPLAKELTDAGWVDASKLGTVIGAEEFSLSGDASTNRIFASQEAATAQIFDLTGRMRALITSGGPAALATPGQVTRSLQSIADQVRGFAQAAGGQELLGGQIVEDGTLANGDLYSIPEGLPNISAAIKANLVPLAYALARAQDPRDRITENQVQQNLTALAAQFNTAIEGGSPDALLTAMSEVERAAFRALQISSVQTGLNINKELFPEELFRQSETQDDQINVLLEDARRRLEQLEESLR